MSDQRTGAGEAWPKHTGTVDGVELCRNPIFIIGSPRSGTTAMAAALQRHSRLWGSHESYFVHDLFGHGRTLATYRRHADRATPSWLQTEAVACGEFLAALGVGVNVLFSRRSGGLRWVDQTPLYTLMVDELAEMFPEAQFVHVLRDGRRVVNSMNHFSRAFDANERDHLPQWAGDFGKACATWSRWVNIALDFSERHPARCTTVVTDVAAADPRHAFARLFSFLGEPDEPAPADFYGQGPVNSSFPEQQRPQAPWRSWTPQQQRTFDDVAGQAFARFEAVSPGSVTS